VEWADVKNVSLFTKMPPLIFNVGLFLGRRYWGDVKGLFCVSELWLYILLVRKVMHESIQLGG